MRFKKITAVLFATYFLCIQYSFACTGIIIRTENGVTIPARTMEFGFDIRSKILVIPKGTSISFLSSVEGKEGYKMKAKYGFAGMNAVEKEIVIDGINEAGLYLGSFYFSGFAKYDTLDSENKSRAISSEEVGNYILGSFATVDEVIEGLNKVSVVGSFIADIQGEAPFHYAVTDKSGRSIVVEYTDAGLRIFENTVNAVCNNPTYDWHMTNLRNYVNLTPDNSKGFSLNDDKYTALGEGTGMLGLPGDYTSPSRFVRATAYINTALPSKNAEEGVFRAFHILNAFDIPKGLVREETNGQVMAEYTIWTTVADTKNGAYYFKTYNNQSIKKLDLKQILKQVDGKVTVIDSETPRGYKLLSSN